MSGRAPLYGLVLAGGASRRMGCDKALLDYHGRPQLEWAYALLSRHCERAYVSVRAGQANPRLRDALLADLRSRRGRASITAYHSAHDSLPEPLCAIYEPAAVRRLADAARGDAA